MASFQKGNGAFTLIELLVVVTIMGILASIVLVSLSSARIKARDTRRIADIRQVVLALEFYADHYRSYPPIGASTTPAARWQKLKECLEAQAACTDNKDSFQIMPVAPEDPTNLPEFQYDYSPDSVGGSFLIKAKLEGADNAALLTDVDGKQVKYSNIECDDPAYCVEI
ncbi:MAG: type II secretion system protein [Candidatus Spechtbacteria bacterium]|nr:type II secretion system protein [Candidatus Spechtbacteria bacterium]